MKKGLTFSEYVAMHMNKSYNREDIKEQPTVSDIAGPADVMKQVDPKTWNAKIINDEKILFFNNHHLNITKLRKEIQKIYSENGYEHYGFSKLSEGELVRYKTLRDILMFEFLGYGDEELDPAATAKIIFDNEAKDFNWQPEPLTLG